MLNNTELYLKFRGCGIIQRRVKSPVCRFSAIRCEMPHLLISNAMWYNSKRGTITRFWQIAYVSAARCRGTRAWEFTANCHYTHTNVYRKFSVRDLLPSGLHSNFRLLHSVPKLLRLVIILWIGNEMTIIIINERCFNHRIVRRQSVLPRTCELFRCM